MSVQNRRAALARGWSWPQRLLHASPIRARRADATARATAEALVPASWQRRVTGWQHDAEWRVAERARQRRAAHEARPRVGVRLTLAGAVRGAVDAEIPILVHRPAAPVDAFVVELEPLDPLPVAGRAFLGVTFAVPGRRGAGRYDLGSLAAALGDGWDPCWFQLWLDTSDEPFLLDVESDTAGIELGADGCTIALWLPLAAASGERVAITLQVTLPT